MAWPGKLRCVSVHCRLTSLYDRAILVGMTRISNAALGGAAIAFLVLAAVLITVGIGQAHPARTVFTRPAHVAIYHRPAQHVRHI